jgi:hypothetical protein
VVSHWPELESDFTALVTDNDDIDDQSWEIRKEMGLPGRMTEGVFGDNGEQGESAGDAAQTGPRQDDDEGPLADDVRIAMGGSGWGGQRQELSG